MSSQRSQSHVLIVDARELRLAGIVGLMTEWAEASSITLHAMQPSDAIAAIESEQEWRMIVLSVGALSITSRENAQWIKVMRALAPEAPIVVVSDAEEPGEVVSALTAGVQGFLPTSISQELALQAFSFILAGGSYFPPSAIRDMPAAQSHERDPGGGGRVRRTEPAPPVSPSARATRQEPDDEGASSSLTNRQHDVLELLKEGEPNKVIARKLGMTEATVKVHVRHIMRKLGASNRTQAALCATAAANEPGIVRGMPAVTAESRFPRLWAAE